MDKIEGYELLKVIIENSVTHDDYKRVVELADKYYKMKTGDELESLLKVIETRVSDEEFAQIKKIYRSIIPSTLNSTKLPFLKAARKQPVVREITYPEEAEQKKSELENYISTYWGDKSLEEYLEYAFVDYNYVDPNAFLITEFADFDPKTETAEPYPFVSSSQEAVMFEYANELLMYLVVKLPVKYLEKGLEKEGFKFTMYLGLDTVEFVQVGSDYRSEGNEVLKIKDSFYEVWYYEPKNEKVPAIRFGYLRDEQTKGRTFVSVFHSVMGFLEKTLKIDSELDLSCAMVAFPQRFQYVSPCKNQGCRRGVMLDGTTCSVCQGTGQEPFHKGTQDIITLTLPTSLDPAQMIDLERLLIYKYPPIELLNFQRDYLEYLKTTAYELMFNVDRFTRAQVAITATESIQGQDNLNDTLYPFARHYSAVWEFVVRDIATFTDLGEGLTVQHKFPNDFKFKSLNELMIELQTAKNAGASTSTIAAIEDDINEILYSDRPDELKEMRIKNMINPFRGYSEANIRFVIGNGNTTIYNRTLWENLESIFTDLEQENTEFYDKAEAVIFEKVKEMTNRYILQIQAEKQAEFDKFIAQQQTNQGGQ